MKGSGLLRTLLIASAACLLYGVSSGIRSHYGVMLGAITADSGLGQPAVRHKVPDQGRAAGR